MTEQTTTPAPAVSVPKILLGVGLISLGIVLAWLLIFREWDRAASSDLSAVPAQQNYPAPELTLATLNGEVVSLAEYQGQVVLVNLWATWCQPCKREMPIFQAFYEKYKAEGFVLIGINQEEQKEIVAPFVEAHELSFPIWLDLDYQAQQKFHTGYIPTSYVIDRSGNVRLSWVGQISMKNLEKFVPEIIRE
ncbi:MAG: TlpA family protein disulfide reductase [Anaerolineales bacterium]|nr:TlpA family protein disulfide reductase [Anaerolineales bacterium]